jgi:hypothetical protein
MLLSSMNLIQCVSSRTHNANGNPQHSAVQQGRASRALGSPPWPTLASQVAAVAAVLVGAGADSASHVRLRHHGIRGVGGVQGE